LTKQALSKRQRIESIRKDIQVQKSWLASQKTELAGQVRAAYALGGQEQLRLWFNQQEAERTSRIMTYYQYFNKARLEKLERINTSLQLLSALEQEKQQAMLLLENLLVDKKEQQSQLSVTKKQRKQLLVKIKQAYRKNRSQLSKLQKNARQLKNLVTQLQKNAQNVELGDSPALPFVQLKGKLPWPVHGKIVRSFGSRRSDSKWQGVLLRAEEGAKVRAIAHGQVVFADWFKGHGFLLIIKHDKSYLSLYAFNQNLDKEVGDWVESGDVVATVGNSGGQDKAGLYFEIRKNGKPQNPKKWCGKKDK
jgi:septal ring factor EnvC (AmiA/AmiB activator)